MSNHVKSRQITSNHAKSRQITPNHAKSQADAREGRMAKAASLHKPKAKERTS
jgi:hypothetical protein